MEKKTTQTERKRIRRSHTVQMEVLTAKKLAEDRGENVPTSISIWSDFETIVLVVIIDSVKVVRSQQ